jgi:hypothetical protein
MTQEAEMQSYRGVVCLHCRQPVPISPLVASIEADLHAKETTPRQHQKCQVFNLRCAACGKEKPYKIGEILEFEGTPVTPTTAWAMPASAYLSPLRVRTKVAST